MGMIRPAAQGTFWSSSSSAKQQSQPIPKKTDPRRRRGAGKTAVLRGEPGILSGQLAHVARENFTWESGGNELAIQFATGDEPIVANPVRGEAERLHVIKNSGDRVLWSTALSFNEDKRCLKRQKPAIQPGSDIK